jgi:hypothetical protein
MDVAPAEHLLNEDLGNLFGPNLIADRAQGQEHPVELRHGTGRAHNFGQIVGVLVQPSGEEDGILTLAWMATQLVPHQILDILLPAKDNTQHLSSQITRLHVAFLH